MPDLPERSPAPSPDEPHDLKIARLLGEYADLLSSGEPGNAEKFLKDHPEIAMELASAGGTPGVFSALLAGQQHRGRFGDFDLILELGRGGMGIVYEAFQTSLGRRVALKILPAGLLSDARAVARFHREAKVAASLHHSHIVPVYTMGVEGGTPYFAMELCVGETLQKIVGRLRAGAGTDPVSVGSMLLLSSRSAPRSPVNGLDLEKTEDGSGTPRPAPHRMPGRAFCLEVAGMLADTAEGLEHAHNLKVIHRDLKPSNLILDVDGRLRILDFSLAWIDGEQRLTLSRDRLGTPLYMSPEQARGDVSLIGPATDIYGLGATLHELLTWRPPFEGRDVREILHEIVHREATPPRRLNRAIPKDLETIVLTCLRKDPRERYSSARDLADDLRAVARGEPIKRVPRRALLRRVTASAWRFRKAALLCAALLGVLAAAASLHWKRQEDLYERNVLEAVKCLVRRELRAPLATLARPKVESRVLDLDAGRLIRGAQPDLGIAVVMVAGCELVDPEAKVGPGGLDEDPQQRADLKQARIHVGEAIRLLPGRPEAHFYLARILSEEGKLQEAAQALARGGRLVAGRGSGDSVPRDATGGIEVAPNRAWREAGDSFARGRWTEAARGLDAALASGHSRFAGWELETLVKAGIANLRAQRFARARECLVDARRIAGDMLEIDLLQLKADCLDPSMPSAGKSEAVIKESAAKAAAPLREAITIAVAEAYMDIGELSRAKEWIENVADGAAKDGLRIRLRRIMAMTLRQFEFEILEESQAAAALAPSDVATRLCLGNAYLANHSYKEAREAFEKAWDLAPGDPRPPVGIGICLWAQKRQKDARASFEAALKLDARHVPAHYNLGVALEALGDQEAAEGSYRSALDLDPDHALARNNLGVILFSRNLSREAAEAFQRAVELSPLLGLARYNHGFALQGQWRFPEAVAEYREALRLRIIDPVVRKNLGFCLGWLRRAEEAYEELKQANAMDPACAWTQSNLGIALYHLSRYEEAIQHLNQAIVLEPLWANAHNNLGLVLQGAGRAEEALSEFDKAFRIDPMYVHAANDYSHLVLGRGLGLPGVPDPRELMERLEDSRHLAGADEAIDRLLDECRRAPEHDLATLGSIDALLDEPEVLIADGEEWQYSREAGMSPPDRAWTAPDFSDGEWTAGASGFGPRAEGNVRTVLEPTERKTSLHLRHRFVVANPSRFRVLVLRVSSNTGWIAYLNKKELCRFLAGPPGARETVAEVDPHPWLARELRAETSLLEEGENLLALEALAVLDEKVEVRVHPVLKAIPRFDEAAHGRVLARFAASRAVAGGPGADARRAYFKAGILERLERYAGAERLYRKVIDAGVKRHEPVMALARCLLAMERHSEAARILWAALDLTAAGHVPLWREWLRVSFVELERSPAELLSDVADRFGADDAAFPSPAQQTARDTLWALRELSAGRPLRINCGGPDYTDESGMTWSEDKLYQGGFPFYLFHLAGEHHGFPASRVYETERYFTDHARVQRGYEIPLPKGKYRVTLHFVEGHWKRPGSRSFDVYIEGEVLENYEPLRAGFGIPQTLVREVAVMDGALNVSFGRRIENPKISAIEVERLE